MNNFVVFFFLLFLYSLQSPPFLVPAPSFFSTFRVFQNPSEGKLRERQQPRKAAGSLRRKSKIVHHFFY